MTVIDPNLPQISSELKRYVSRFVDAVRWRRLVQRSTDVADFACVWLVLSCIIDRLFALSSAVRLVNEGAIAVIVTWLLWPRIWRLTRRVVWVDAAQIIEQQDERFAGRLTTTMSLGLQPEILRGSASMWRSIEADVIALIQVATPMNRRWSKRQRISIAILASFAVALGIVSLAHRQTTWALLVRQLAPLADQPSVTSTMLRIIPGDISRVAGERFLITAHADRLDDALPVLSYTLGEAPLTSVTMPATADGYAFEFAALDQPLRYRIRAGRAQSRWFNVKLIQPVNSAFVPASSQSATTETRGEQAAMDAYLKRRSELQH